MANASILFYFCFRIDLLSYCAPLTVYGLLSLTKLTNLKVLYLPVPLDSEVVHGVLYPLLYIVSINLTK